MAGGDLLRHAVGTGVRHDMAAHPITLDQLGPQWGGGGHTPAAPEPSELPSCTCPFPYSQAGEEQFAVGFSLAQPPKWPVLA